MIYSKELKHKADILFWIFEAELFQNTGNYPRQTNLVLEFADFIEHSTQEDLEQYITFTSTAEYTHLRQMILQGIDLWLDPGQIKTLFYT
ncbi:MAG: hypothetical protein IJ660_05585 [Alphaproteobacteria bacterium]|nr:hypothetical protein [Alphaproteobacteria bacterium]